MILVRIDRIKGDVKIEGYKDWFLAESVDFGVGRKVQASASSSKDLEEEKPEEQELSISKTVDSSTVYLMHAAMKGRTDAFLPFAVDIHFIQNRPIEDTNKKSVHAFLKIRIENAIITDWSIDGSDDDRPKETVKIWFNRAAMKYRAVAENHTYETHGPLGWDQQANKDWKSDVLLKNDG